MHLRAIAVAHHTGHLFCVFSVYFLSNHMVGNILFLKASIGLHLYQQHKSSVDVIIGPTCMWFTGIVMHNELK